VHAARDRMLKEELDAAVAAFEVGYESASQFRRRYKRLFGQPPVADVNALSNNRADHFVGVAGKPEAIPAADWRATVSIDDKPHYAQDPLNDVDWLPMVRIAALQERIITP